MQLSSSSFSCIAKSSLRRHYRVTLVYTASNIAIFASDQSWRSYPHTADVRHDLLIGSSSSLALFTRSTNLLGRKKAGGSAPGALTLSIRESTKTFLKRSFSVPIPNNFLSLYTIFIQPHLEYTIEVNHHSLPRDTGALRKVQELALKFVKGLWHVP